jgi:hypothetical protein
MTVANQIRKDFYNGNGVSNSFPVTFGFFELNVYVDDVLKTEGVHYDITQAEPGETGTIVFKPGHIPPSGTNNVAFVGTTEIIQSVDYEENSSFPAEVQERALDRLTMIAREQTDRFSNVLRVPDNAQSLPELDMAGNPGTLLYINSSGVPELAPVVGGPISQDLQDAIDAANAAALASEDSAVDALGYANAASASAVAASSSASSAASVYDAFDDRYLGAKASDPTLDNDGNALLTGALYWSTTTNKMRAWSGSAWSNVTSASDTFVNVRDYGAKGDLSQNDTPFIQAAIDAAAGRTVYIPVGRYRLDSALVSTLPLHIVGDGNGSGPGPSAQSNNNVTQLMCFFSSGDVIQHTSNYPAIFENFQINTTPAARPRTSGAAIHISGPGGSTNANSVVRGVGITNPYEGIRCTRCVMQRIENNYVDAFARSGYVAVTSVGIEASAGIVRGNYFYGNSGSTTQLSCITTQVGYTYIQNNLILGSSNGIQVAIANHPAGSIHILDNFIENQGTFGVAISSIDGNASSMVKVARNEFSNYAFVSNWGASILVSDYSSGTDWLDDLEICNNVHRHALDVNHRVIWVQSGRTVAIRHEQIENIGTGSSTRGIDMTTFAGAALKAPITVEGCQFRGTFGIGRYSLPASVRLVEPEMFVTVQGSDVSLSNSSTSAQNIFASANDVLTLEAATTYFFEAEFYIATGTTTHTTALGFVASSAFTSIKYQSQLWSTTSGTISTTAPSVLDVNASTATVLNATSTAPLTTIRVKGMIRTAGATTMTPQITFSAGPGGTCAVKTDSWLRIWPVGSNAKVFHGDWA